MKIRRFIAAFLASSLVAGLIPGTHFVYAADSPFTGKVVINEIAWAGSSDSSTDEWIELYNDSDIEIDLSGWKIIDDSTTEYVISSGKIAAKGYFLIEDKESSVSTIEADSVIPISLANSGDTLALHDAQGNSVDLVNRSGGAWYAGNSSQYATMERIAVTGSDSPDNWKDASLGTGEQASNGAHILGTPKAVNSKYVAPVKISLIAPEKVAPGGQFTVQVAADTVSDLFSYGFDLKYDDQLLKFSSANSGSLLSNYQNDSTSFQAALLGNAAGTLVVGEARTESQVQKKGISGTGVLFEAVFTVLGQQGATATVSVDSKKSFLSTYNSGDLLFETTPLKITIDSQGSGGVVHPASQLTVSEDDSRYALTLRWQASDNADSYTIMRKGVDGTFLKIGTTTETRFVDTDSVQSGGNLIPGLIYEYQVIAVTGESKSDAISASGTETRGLPADSSRDDRVDGRDLDLMAKTFGLDITFESFNPRSDLNYDGKINGSDLIDLGLGWAQVYTTQ